MGGIIECLYKLVTDKVLFMCCLLLSRMLCSELINKKKMHASHCNQVFTRHVESDG